MIFASPGGGMRSGAGSGPGCTGWWRARAGGGSGLLHTVQYSTVQGRGW